MRWLLALALTAPALAEEPVEEAGRTLSITDLTVGEGLEREAFLKAIYTRWEPLEACYDAALADHPTLGGQWNATLVLTKKKGVTEIKPNYASVNLERLEGCYAQALQGLMFEDKKAEGELTFSLTGSPGELPLSAYEAASRYGGGEAKLGTITVQGGVDEGAVVNAVTPRLPFLRGCFSESLQRRATQKAMVVLKVRTEQGGTIEGVELIRSGLRDDTAERCMVALAEKLELELAEDAPPGVAVVPISYRAAK